MLSECRVVALDHRLIEICFYDRSFEVVDLDDLWNAAEKPEGINVAKYKCPDCLVQCYFGIHVS